MFLQSFIQGGIIDIGMTKCAHINTLDNHFLTTVSAISKLKIATKSFKRLKPLNSLKTYFNRNQGSSISTEGICADPNKRA